MLTPDSPAAPDPLLPPRVAWFALWRWKPWKLFLAGIAMAGICYPLSIGPAVFACRLGVVSVGAVEEAYRPVLFCVYESPLPVQRCVWHYLRLWGQDHGIDVWAAHGFRGFQRKFNRNEFNNRQH